VLLNSATSTEQALSNQLYKRSTRDTHAGGHQGISALGYERLKAWSQQACIYQCKSGQEIHMNSTSTHFMNQCILPSFVTNQMWQDGNSFQISFSFSNSECISDEFSIVSVLINSPKFQSQAAVTSNTSVVTDWCACMCTYACTRVCMRASAYAYTHTGTHKHTRTDRDLIQTSSGPPNSLKNVNENDKLF